MRDAEINRYATVYLHLCFLSAIHSLIHLIFVGTETPRYVRKVIEGPFEYKLVFFAKALQEHMKLEKKPVNNEGRSLVNTKCGETFLTFEVPFNHLPYFQL